MNDQVDSRILGAIRFADAVTGVTIQRPLRLYAGPDFSRSLLEPGDVQAIQNRSGIYAVRRAPGMDRISQSFDLSGVGPVTPATFAIRVTDPLQVYLPRTASITLPRSTTVPPTDSTSIFQAQQITLYPTPAATGRPTWASVFVTVTAQGDPNKRLAWVLIQAQRPSDSAVLASSFTDSRGEGQLSLAVAGIRANTTGGGSVVAVGTDLSIVAIYDPTIAQQDTTFVPNPDDLLRRAGDATMKRATPAAVTVQAGQTKSIAMSIALS